MTIFSLHLTIEIGYHEFAKNSTSLLLKAFKIHLKIHLVSVVDNTETAIFAFRLHHPFSVINKWYPTSASVCLPLLVCMMNNFSFQYACMCIGMWQMPVAALMWPLFLESNILSRVKPNEIYFSTLCLSMKY